jgi:DNA (cytosine-5)-methyltransferase 1
VLWASPICTELSPAGGRARPNQPDLFEEHGHVPKEAFTRTRVTFWEVVRAVEVHRYDLVFIENVVEAAAWELFEAWLMAVQLLGYDVQFVSVSAAHIGDDRNPRAPQWRDRIYIVFRRKGIQALDLEPKPLAYCAQCGVVEALQWWKRDGRRIGKYGQQYLYVCPEGDHGVVEPFTAPAAAAIDWTNPGTRIGDWTRPRAASTMRRIQTGIDMWRRGDFDREFVFSVNHNGDGRHFDPAARPMPTETVKRGEGLVIVNRTNNLPRSLSDPLAPMTTGRNHGLVVAAAGNTYDAASRGEDGYVRVWPADGAPLPSQTTDAQFALVTTLRRNGDTTPVDGAPLPTFTAGGTHHGLIMKSQGGHLEDRHAWQTVGEPLPAMRAKSWDALVIPYRKGAKPHAAGHAPLSTQTTREQHAILRPEVDINDCYFRMLTPREAANAQAFPQDYIIHGNKGEQQMQAGNAVAVNVACWLGLAGAAVLDSASGQ